MIEILNKIKCLKCSSYCNNINTSNINTSIISCTCTNIYSYQDELVSGQKLNTNQCDFYSKFIINKNAYIFKTSFVNVVNFNENTLLYISFNNQFVDFKIKIKDLYKENFNQTIIKINKIINLL